jgi:hypothetical protein
MAMNSLSNDDAPLTSASTKNRMRNRAFVTSKVFVTTALSCGKIAPFLSIAHQSKSS